MSANPRDAAFRDALQGLRNGDFSRLEPLFVGDPSNGNRAAILTWYDEGRFANEPQALAEALTCACFLGRVDVATYLIDRGVDPSGGTGTGLDALHWAANRGQLEAVRLLLRHHVSLETLSMHRGTVLGTALWSAVNEPRPAHPQIIEELLAAGALVDDQQLPNGFDSVDAVLRHHRA